MFTIDSAALGWAAFAILAAVIEILVPHFGIIFAAMGAVAAAIAAVFGVGLPFQIALFLVTTGVSVALLRQRFVSGLGKGKMLSRSEALINHEGVVTHDIEALVGSGRVNVGGEDWAARAHMPLAAGTRVIVVRTDGIVLEVTPV